jgi:D-alanyl-lipoteichoic acid acyltransferase DltB (MBOAT superfamily)
MQWNPKYVLLLLSSTLVTYFGGLFVEKVDNPKYRKLCLIVALVINLSVLGYFKYANMFMDCINNVLSVTGKKEIPWDNDILLPVGISFFTLQALGYLIDVYRKEIYAERNILKYALFISFFPQLVAGPIERSKNLLKQLAVPKSFSYENLRRGLMIMLYGFFLKVVIADRIAIFVDTVYNDPISFPGVYIIIATVCFALQIYCDFYGYSTIAKGVALTMGITLMDNFNAPYFSKSVKEFWRRWHISLSTWFRDYLYIPLGGNRKGQARKYLNLMIVFSISGLWHGASFAFVLWGVLHGLYQILESLLGDKKITNKVLKLVITLVLVGFAWLFFRANNLNSAKLVLTQLFTNWNLSSDQSLFTMGISMEYWCVLLIAIAVLFVVDYRKYKGCNVLEAFMNQKWIVRSLAIVALLFYIITFGCYGSEFDVQQFIYFQF